MATKEPLTPGGLEIANVSLFLLQMGSTRTTMTSEVLSMDSLHRVFLCSFAKLFCFNDIKRTNAASTELSAAIKPRYYMIFVCIAAVR